MVFSPNVSPSLTRLTTTNLPHYPFPSHAQTDDNDGGESSPRALVAGQLQDLQLRGIDVARQLDYGGAGAGVEKRSSGSDEQGGDGVMDVDEGRARKRVALMEVEDDGREKDGGLKGSVGYTGGGDGDRVGVAAPVNATFALVNAQSGDGGSGDSGGGMGLKVPNLATPGGNAIRNGPQTPPHQPQQQQYQPSFLPNGTTATPQPFTFTSPISSRPPSPARTPSRTPIRSRRKSPPPPGSTTTTTSSPTISPLTWQDSEITGHLALDPQDDGYGVNGIGFRPTAAMAYARSQKRKQQVKEWKTREAREAVALTTPCSPAQTT